LKKMKFIRKWVSIWTGNDEKRVFSSSSLLGPENGNWKVSNHDYALLGLWREGKRLTGPRTVTITAKFRAKLKISEWSILWRMNPDVGAGGAICNSVDSMVQYKIIYYFLFLW
jgi:hypothetical protein